MTRSATLGFGVVLALAGATACTSSKPGGDTGAGGASSGAGGSGGAASTTSSADSGGASAGGSTAEAGGAGGSGGSSGGASSADAGGGSAEGSGGGGTAASGGFGGMGGAGGEAGADATGGAASGTGGAVSGTGGAASGTGGAVSGTGGAASSTAGASGGTGGGGAGGTSGAGGTGGTCAAPSGGTASVAVGSNYSLPHLVVDAAYSPDLAKIVLLTEQPDQLVLVDTTTFSTTAVDLPASGSTVSVAPSGLEAAVAHYGALSVVNLECPRVEVTIETYMGFGDVVLADNGFAYVFPAREDDLENFGDIHSVDLAEEFDHGWRESTRISVGIAPVLHPSGSAIYGANANLEHYDISAGVAGTIKDAPYHGKSIGPGIWISKDGERIFTAGGATFLAAPGTESDMTYAETLEDTAEAPQYPTRYLSLDHDPSGGRVFAVVGNRGRSGVFALPGPREARLEVFDDESLAFVGTVAIPPIIEDDVSYTAYAKHVFVIDDGARLFVVSKSESARLRVDWAIALLEPD